MADKSVHAGHRKRVKANVYKNGFSQFEEHQLLELMLFYSIPREDTNELAHRIIDDMGSFDEIFKASIDRLKKIEGVGENTAIMLAAMGEAFKRISNDKTRKKPTYKTNESLKSLALASLENEHIEKVVIFCFDSSYKLKKQMVLGEGNGCSASVDLCKAVQAVMDSGSTCAVLAHNHPSCAAEPSAQDVDTTRNVSVMFRKLGFSLVDHIIVGNDGDAYSMHSDSRFKGMFY